MVYYMARTKIYCKGTTSKGTPCGNWAIKGSYYCQIHQNQETEQDRENQQDIRMYSSIIVLIIVIVGLLISFAVGCEDEFLKWMSR